ncbi:hypothetical protein PRK78_003500 [Emydomyces testavorans]|uniref:Rhodopsin domain-containing protein n=1 Tax=Emydomyces testavorans TaxID=2070801 RepID=A0AAF0IIF1_9EURO|nr:hypothetical protein PRK78_003500 [Emydomyces testavorans]
MSAPSVDPYTGGDRFATITQNDHRGVLWVASILCATYSLLSFALRFYVKRNLLGLDDYLAAAATTTAEAQFIAVFCGIAVGLGKAHLGFDDYGIEKIGKSVLASQVLFILALGYAKASVVLLVRRLFSPDMHRHLRLCDALLVVERWIGVEVADIVTEISIVCMSMVVVWKAHMKLHRKARVVVAFIPRLGLVIFAALRLFQISNYTKQLNTGVAIAGPLVYQQVELCYSLITSAIPNLGGFMIQFSTGMGLGGMGGYATPGYSSHLESMELSTTKSAKSDVNKGPTPDRIGASALKHLREETGVYSDLAMSSGVPHSRPSSSQEGILEA